MDTDIKNLVVTWALAFIFCVMAVSTPAKAISPRGTRDLLHVGGGAAAYGLSYYVWRQIIPNPDHKWVCHLFSAFMVTTAAASWELQHVGKESVNRPSGRDFGYGTLGAGAVMGATIVLGF